MYRAFKIVSFTLAMWMVSFHLLGAAEPVDSSWHTDYTVAMDEANRRGKMLLLYFCDPEENELCNRFKAETLGDPMVREKLREYVLAQIPLDTTVVTDGKQVTLLEHAAFKEMLGKPGIAILDFTGQDPALHGRVVSTFPITKKLYYTPEKMAVILDLPPGTLTQRTLIYAVRTHPEKPASTEGKISPDLLREAENHSEHQAQIRRQGHHRWGTRVRRILGRLSPGMMAREVCAESWPGENLLEAAIECVRSWRHSSGHWSAVRARHRFYGYDMKRGSNGTWYATGIFGGK